MKSLLLLGSTGSIGSQALDLVREEWAARGGPGSSADALAVAGLAARSSWETVLRQTREFRPRFVGLVDPAAAERFEDALEPELRRELTLFSGEGALEELVAEAEYDLAVNGVVGAAGLAPSVGVLERGRTLALANKESLVVAGELLMELSRSSGAPILPVDSEHCGIFQCLNGEDLERVRCVVLTASGGALRDLPLEELEAVTPDMALRHPTWEMGPRITIDSATLMNKALEVIETHHLYGLESERIRVVMHRQSIVHALVEFVDGSVIAQMGPPDMRGPIHQALHHPLRVPSKLRGFDVDLFRDLSFAEPDPARFPALALGYRCVEEGGDAGCVLNAADEVSVQAFLDGRIGFQDIHAVNRSVLDRRASLRSTPAGPSPEESGGAGVPGAADARTAELEALLGVDRAARELARERIEAAQPSSAR